MPETRLLVNFACFGFKTEFLMKFLNDSAWFCVEEPKKIRLWDKNIKTHIKNQKNPKKYTNICKEIAFLRAPKGALLKGIGVGFFWIFRVQVRFWSKIMFLMEKPSFFGSSTQNHAESFENLIKNSVLDPKRAKLVHKSYGRFTESLRNLPRPVQEYP